MESTNVQNNNRRHHRNAKEEKKREKKEKCEEIDGWKLFSVHA
jgi:hypothetical protein